MARSLNKSRILIGRVLVLLAVVIVLIFRQTFMDDTPAHEVFDMVGLFCLFVCAIGRVYATAFLGGRKNQTVVDYGPFSVVRNPLYVFSLIGITGIALMSNHIVVMLALPVAFYFLYQALIKREECFLEETFGQSYRDYKQAVPRFWPKFSNYRSPETMEVAPKLLFQAARDALLWFLPFALFELVEAAQAVNWLPEL